MCEETSELHPVYDTPEPNQNIPLSKEKVIIAIDKDTVDFEADVIWEFVPVPRVKIYGELPPNYSFQDTKEHYTLCLPKRNLSMDVLICEFRLTSHPPVSGLPVTVEPRPQPFTAMGSGASQLKKVVFHLVNFRDFYAEPIIVKPKPTQSLRLDQVELNAGGWKIILASMVTTRNRIRTLRAKGGYVITHVGQIEREDAEPFAEQEAEDIILSLYYFFSFARGFWTGPFLPVGFDDSNERIWEQWGTLRADPWQYVSSWFDERIGNLLAKLFPEFLRLWQSGKWQKPLKDAVYWYVASNTSSKNLDTGIILNQAALELLAWNYVVKDRMLISEEGFEKLWASDQFRLLLSSLDIPLEVPSHLKALNSLTKSHNWVDAPQTLAEIRNDIIHPKKKVESKPLGAMYEAWSLGLWYIELVLLRLLGHEGQYGNRLVQKWRGQTEMVPWVGCNE
jgi:hypothetical protein